MKKEKKPKEKEKKSKDTRAAKIVLVMVCVIIIFFMIISGMSMTGAAGMIQMFRAVKANDSVTVGFTLRDTQGMPVLTTDQNLYRSTLMSGGLVFLTSPITVKAGYTGSPAVTTLPADNYYLTRAGVSATKFAILGQELDGLDVGVLGMKANEQRTVRLNISDPLTLSMKDYEFNSMGGNFTNIVVGDQIPFGISETPLTTGLEGSIATPTNSGYRVAMVINKTGSTLEVQHLYPTADISVTSIS